MLIGNVGKDPEVRYIDNGVCTAKVALATNTPGYTLPNGTQVPDRAEWHNLLFWRKLAEVVERYVHKGDKLYVEGELRTRNYTDHQGVVRYITEIWGCSLLNSSLTKTIRLLLLLKHPKQKHHFDSMLIGLSALEVQTSISLFMD